MESSSDMVNQSSVASASPVMMRDITEVLGRSRHIYIFVHCVTSVGEMPGINLNDDESHRALILAREQDIVVVPSPVEDGFIDYLSELGLEVNQERIVVASEGSSPSPTAPLSELLLANHLALEKIRSLTERELVTLSPFIASHKEWRLAMRLEQVLQRQVRLLGASPELVQSINLKHNSQQKAIDFGVPVAPGEVVHLRQKANGKPSTLRPLEQAVRRHLNKTGRVLIRGSFGASGSSTFVIEGIEQIGKALETISTRSDNAIYIVGPLLDLSSSPNVVMWIDPDDGEISCLSATDQCLNPKLVFSGSVFPSTAKLLPEMIAAAHKLTECLRDEHFCGPVGFDFGEYQDMESREHKYFLSEINARTNGGMYAKVLLEKLNARQQRRAHPPIAAFLSASIETTPLSFTQLRKCCSHLLFDPSICRGVVPFNPGRLKDGKVTIACFGRDRNDVEQLLKESQRALLSR